ncbi:hypothetical protein Mgra_00008755 [Meloidogyne graminicola]|uniref:Uncharacterized protein n=1 Tax=Meloidogyne graminicola TaxID=189291 RepID=A0A8S9ZER5_9BILA|nr:hypothetical protein Mgra_00008755 [Meloidogyne graminicola]
MQSTNNYLNFCRIYLLKLIQILFIFNIIICLFILQTTLLIKENENNNILINNYTLKDKLKNKIIRSVRLLDERKKEINKNNNLNVGPGEKLNIPIKGGIVPIEWFNFKIINPQRFGRRLGDLRFEVLNQPKYGQLQFNSDISNSREIPLNSFLYSDVLNKKVDISLFSRRAGGGGRISKTGNLINSDQFDIEIDVNEKENNNEIKEKIPKILIEPIGEVINLKIGKRLQLNSNNLRIYNKDISNENILINVEEISENSLDLINKMGERLRQFSLSELLKGNIYLIGLENEEKVDNDNNYELNEDNKNKEGYIKLVAINDFGIQSEPLIIRVLFVPLKIIFDKNIGIQMIHYSSKQIESSQLYSYCISEYNLSFIPSAYYLIVNQPNFGIIECLRNNFNEKNNKKWSICSSFTQNEINSLKVRYTNKRSTNMLLPPKSDDFDFQVFCSSTASLIQNFQIDFITLSIRVFIQETLKLNQTDQGLISRQNILATVFPQHFTTDQLYFNIIEAPKLGMLLRLVIETGRHRRVGISSNITQKQIDEGLFFYKLHFASFSVLNDFFTFRLLTPAGASEEIFRFDIVYLPGGGIGEIKLKNNTLIIEEGKIQEITNNTLWLESSDGNNNYLFRVILPPMNGILFLLNKNENKKNILDFDDIFNSNDILENKLYYKHYGDLSKWDRIYLIAESKIRDPGGGKGYIPLPFFLSISIIGINKRKPQLFTEMYGENFEKNKNLFLLENNEITLLPSHIQLIDLDNLIKWPKSLENFKQFSIANSINSLNFNVIPEPLNSRDFIIFEKELPEIPLREFNENLLNKGNLIIKNVATDGLNNKTLPISIFSISKYFLRLSTPNKIYFNINLNKQKEQQPLFLLISIVHLFVETNIDIFNDNQIIFEVQTIIPNLSPFRLNVQSGGNSTTITSSSSSLQSIYNLPLSSFDNKILNSNSLFYLNKNKEEINKDNFLINLIIQSKENLKIFIQIGPINIPINIITNYLNNNEIKEINKFNKYLGNNLILKKNNPIILDYYFNKTFIKITSEYLQVQSFGISTNKIKFLIWHSIGGIIKYLLSNNLTKKINNFTQEDINQGKIIFQFNKQNNNNNFSGFYFLYSDGINQNNNAEWFLIKQEILNNNLKENIKLINKDYKIERNLILKTTPGIPSIIGPEILKVVGNYEPDKIIYRLTTPPNHGRLFLRDAQEKLEHFTQLDINLNKLIYQTSSTSLGVWKLLDEFGFKIYTTKNNFNENEPKEFKFNIENAYSNIKLKKCLLKY